MVHNLECTVVIDPLREGSMTVVSRVDKEEWTQIKRTVNSGVGFNIMHSCLLSFIKYVLMHLRSSSYSHGRRSFLMSFLINFS